MKESKRKECKRIRWQLAGVMGFCVVSFAHPGVVATKAVLCHFLCGFLLQQRLGGERGLAGLGRAGPCCGLRDSGKGSQCEKGGRALCGGPPARRNWGECMCAHVSILNTVLCESGSACRLGCCNHGAVVSRAAGVQVDRERERLLFAADTRG